VRPGDRRLAKRLEAGLLRFSRNERSLTGIRASAKRGVLLEQLVESVRRVKFIAVLRTRDLSERRTDPDDELFDPLRAAILHQRRGDIEEAFWLVLLSVHFGRNARGGWRYAREVYGRLGDGNRWDWARTSADPQAFRAWLNAHLVNLKREGTPGGFGNHRKYQSLDAYSPTGTGAAVESYVNWVGPPRTHQELMTQALQRAGGNGRKAFDDLYRSMHTVASFGRMARFDYLTMLGKLHLAPIRPGSAYLQGSSGPLQGARLLFGRKVSGLELDRWLIQLDKELKVGMQVLEDALCNWQKSPNKFKPFRG